MIGHALKRTRNIDVHRQLPHLAHQTLDDGEDVFLGDKGHLDVDLGKLRLAILAQVLVAEAADDLKVAIHARDHEQLLEDLRRLGQGVKLARV